MFDGAYAIDDSTNSTILSGVPVTDTTEGDQLAPRWIQPTDDTLKASIQEYQFRIRVDAEGGGYDISETFTLKVGCLPGGDADGGVHFDLSDGTRNLSRHIGDSVGDIYNRTYFDFTIRDPTGKLGDVELDSLITCKVKKYEIVAVDEDGEEREVSCADGVPESECPEPRLWFTRTESACCGQCGDTDDGASSGGSGGEDGEQLPVRDRCT